jgi:hypothetical protein
MEDVKHISTYDCFYLINNNNDDSKILLGNIIYCVNHIINKLSDNTKSSKKSKISNLIEFYEIYTKKYNSNSKTTYNIKKDEILKTYMNFDETKYTKSKKVKEYLNMLKPTQNGYGDIPKTIDKYFNKSSKKIHPDFIRNSKIIKGGDSLSYTNQNYIPALLEFCQHHGSFIGPTDYDDIKPILLSLSNLVDQSYNFIALYYFIANNDQNLSYSYTIDFNNYDIDHYDIIEYNQRHPNYHTQFIRKCNHKEYNKEIILSYEIFQYYYRDNLQNYIDQQILYISTLTNAEKNIIKDYIRPRTFNFLNGYITNPTPGFISRYLQKWNLPFVNTRLGNSFCDIICAVLPRININDIKDNGYYDDAHISYNSITENEWQTILQLYLIELNRIILGAPATTTNLFCFRGSTSDYVVQNNTFTTPNDVINVHLSNSRPSSISFNFDAAKFFYNTGSYNTSIMYRVLVTPGCKLLFATPLSHNDTKYEMEFIVPIHHVFASNDLFTPTEAYNSFNNKHNICLNQIDKINSKDIILLPI